MFACLDRSLSAAADKDAILRAEKLVLQRKCRRKATPAPAPAPPPPVTGEVAGMVGDNTALAAGMARSGLSSGGGLDPSSRSSSSPSPARPCPSADSSARSRAGASGSTYGNSRSSQGTVVAVALDKPNGGASAGGGDQKVQPKTVGSFFGSNIGRARSATKLVPSLSAAAEAGTAEEAAAIASAAAGSKEFNKPLFPSSRSFRGVGLMKKVGFPRRRASCKTLEPKPPSGLDSPPPLPPRPALPPRLVVETKNLEGFPRQGNDGGDIVASPLSPEAILGRKDDSSDGGSEVGGTNSIVLDGLRLVWTLEIRDGVVSVSRGCMRVVRVLTLNSAAAPQMVLTIHV